MSDWNKNLPDAAKAYLEGRRLDEVECIVSDLPGIARGKAARFKHENFLIATIVIY